MRILHVLAPSPFGGLERVVWKLAGTQHASGEEVHAATVAHTTAGESFLADFGGSGIRIHSATAPERAYTRQRRDLSRLFRTLAPDIIHTHGYHADILAGGPGRRAGAAVVSTVHGFPGGGLKMRGYEWLQRRALRHHDAVVAVSGPLARTLRAAGVAAERLTVLPNIAPSAGPALARPDARSRLGLANDAWVVGWVGRLSHEKGLDVLLDALGGPQTGQARLAVLGDGPERAALGARADSLALAPRVTWCGAVPAADRYFSAFDLRVLSSRTEGSPLVLLEAMAAGVPVVATTVGGVPEAVAPGQALLVPPEDPGALARAIARIRERPRGAARRAASARRRALRASDPAEWAARYREVYAQACTRRATAG